MNNVEFAGTVSPFQVTRCEESVPPFEADTKVTCGGRSSVTVVFVASVPLALVMLMVYVMRSFLFTELLLSVLAMVRLMDEALEELDTDELLTIEDTELIDELELLITDELKLEEEMLLESEELIELALETELADELEREELFIEDELALLRLEDTKLLEADEMELETLLEDELIELDEMDELPDETLLTELVEEEEELLPAMNICLFTKTMPAQRPAATLTTPFSGVTSSWRHPFGTISLTVCVPGVTLSKRARP